VLGFLVILHPSSLILSAVRADVWDQSNPYKARGKVVTATWSVDRTEVPEDGVLTATLTVRGVENPHEVVRPDLKAVKDKDGKTPFAERFRLIENVPGSPPPPDAGEVAFVYRLRPRDRSVNRLPSFDFVYRDTRVPSGDPLRNARATGIDITVTAPAPRPKKPEPPPVPLDEPEHLFRVTTGPAVLDREPFDPGPWAWAAALAAGPVMGLVWYLSWRRVFPDAARLAHLRRTRAARRALDAIRKAGRSADPAGTIAAAVLGYLRARFPLPDGAETPPEIETGLRAVGLPEADATAAAGFFRRADAARFAPPTDTGVSLADEAAALIARLEAVE
jgi:hypothetical protein